MPGKRSLRGVGPKEQRMYEHITEAPRSRAATANERKRWPLAQCSSTTASKVIGKTNSIQALFTNRIMNESRAVGATSDQTKEEITSGVG